LVAYPDVGNRELVIEFIRWKFVAAVAIVAMAVSLLSGGLSGIAFGVLVSRAAVGGILFAVLAAVLNLAVARLFPELFDLLDGSENETDIDVPGSRVDITMPEESPPERITGEEFFDSAGSGGPEVRTGNSGGAADAESVEAERTDGDNPLADLDSFSGEFNDGGEKPESRSSRISGPAGEHDPEEIAQAIHTFIKRDEKG
jgi:hypothetical protein